MWSPKVVGDGLKLVHLGGGPLVHNCRSGSPMWLVHEDASELINPLSRVTR